MKQDAQVLTDLEREIVEAEKAAWRNHASYYLIHKIGELRREVVDLYKETQHQ